MDQVLDTTTWLLALIGATVAGAVSFLGSFDLGHAVYDFLTVGTAGLSVLSGARVLNRSVGKSVISWRAVWAGNTWARGAALTCASTGLSLYHLILMTYWSFQPGDEILDRSVNAAFENWHILIALFLFYLHSWFYKAMCEVNELDA
jgi:hypothetical protein